MKLIIFLILLQIIWVQSFLATKGGRSKHELPTEPFCGVSGAIKQNGRVFNGERAEDDEFPWVAKLKDRRGLIYCTGTLINSQWILTAAQCLRHRLRTAEFGNSYEISIQKAIAHPNYKRGITVNFDIALLYLNSPINFSTHVQPICLPLHYIEVKEGLSAIIAGWGSYANGTTNTPFLRKATLNVRSASDCKNMISQVHSSFVESSQICTASGGCRGDSGGPLMVQSPVTQNFYQIAVTSDTNILCKMELPTVFERVQPYLQWIYGTIRDYE